MPARIDAAARPYPDYAQERLARLAPPGGDPLVLFTTLATDQRLFERFFGGGLLDRGHLTLKQREIVIERITARCRSEYPRTRRGRHRLMPVSAASAQKLRAALARLLAGEPLHTDGALTKENLAREAQVSHATVHRAEDILAEWDAQVARPVLRTPGEVQRDETIADLRKKPREARSTPHRHKASSTPSPR